MAEPTPFTARVRRVTQLTFAVAFAAFIVAGIVLAVLNRQIEHSPAWVVVVLALLGLVALASVLLTWPAATRPPDMTLYSLALAWLVLIPSLQSWYHPGLWLAAAAIVLTVVRTVLERVSRSRGDAPVGQGRA